MKIDDSPFKDGMPPMHPGEFLADDLNEMEVTPQEFDVMLAIPPGTNAAILEGRRDIDAEVALRLSHYFGTTARIWMDLQTTQDLKVAERAVGPRILKEVQPRPDMPTEIPVSGDVDNHGTLFSLEADSSRRHRGRFGAGACWANCRPRRGVLRSKRLRLSRRIRPLLQSSGEHGRVVPIVIRAQP